MHPLKALAEQVQLSLQVVKKTPSIAWVVIFTEIIAMFHTTMFYYLQTYWKDQGWGEFAIGLVLAFTATTSSIGGILAPWVERKLRAGKLYLGAAASMVGTFLLLAFINLVPGLSGFSVLMIMGITFSLSGFGEGIMFVTAGDFVNKRIPSERRATLLSFRSMVFSLFMIILFPLVGFGAELWGIEWMFRGIAMLALISMIGTLGPLIRLMKQDQLDS